MTTIQETHAVHGTARRTGTGVTLALLGRCSAIVGTAVSTTLLAKGLSVLVIAGLEMAVGAVLLMLWCYRAEFRALARRARTWAVRTALSTAGSIAGLAITNMVVRVATIYALVSLPLGVFCALYYVVPLFGSAIDGRRAKVRRRHAFGWPLLACAGIVALTGIWNGGADLIGVVAGLVAGVARSLSLPLSRSHMKAGKEEKYTAFSFVGGAAVLLLWGRLAGDDYAPVWVNVPVMVLVVVLGVFATLIPQLMQLWSRRSISDFVYGMVLSASPVVALGVQALLGQPFTAHQLFGTAAITIAVIGTVLSERRVKAVKGNSARCEPARGLADAEDGLRTESAGVGYFGGGAYQGYGPGTMGGAVHAGYGATVGYGAYTDRAVHAGGARADDSARGAADGQLYVSGRFRRRARPAQSRSRHKARHRL